MPKKKIGKHLEFYYDCMKNDCQMPHIHNKYIGGLCSIACEGDISESILKLFSDGHSIYSYWGAGDGYTHDDRYQFTPLRQTIVLLMAAIKNEL